MRMITLHEVADVYEGSFRESRVDAEWITRLVATEGWMGKLGNHPLTDVFMAVPGEPLSVRVRETVAEIEALMAGAQAGPCVHRWRQKMLIWPGGSNEGRENTFFCERCLAHTVWVNPQERRVGA